MKNTFTSICPICNRPFANWSGADRIPHKQCCSPKCGRILSGLKIRVPRIKYICLTCGKIFFDKAHRNRKYCSHKCANAARKGTTKQVTYVCDYCGQEFMAPDPSEWQTHSPQRFCSQKCKGKGIAKERGLHVRKKVTFTCEHCGKPFTRFARQDRAYHFCSRQCFGDGHRGKRHHCWQGGADRYYGPNWDIQRDRALQRDKNICRMCGLLKDRMSVHHIVSRFEFGQNWEAMNALSNLVTLCPSCHGYLHASHPKDSILPIVPDATVASLR